MVVRVRYDYGDADERTMMNHFARAVREAETRGMIKGRNYDPDTGEVCSSFALMLGVGYKKIIYGHVVIDHDLRDAWTEAASTANHVAASRFGRTNNIQSLLGVNDYLGPEFGLDILKSLADE